MKKNLLVPFIAIFLILTLGLVISLDFQKQTLYPFGKGQNIQLGISHEEIPQNWSQGSFYIDPDSLLHFSYTLSRETPEPFAGLYLHGIDSSGDRFLDFASFDQLSINLKADHGKRIPVFLTLDYQGFTKSGKALSWLPLSAIIEYEGKGTYTLNKRDFEIPSWWLRLHQMKKEDFTKLDFARLTHVVINSCQTLGPGKADHYSIQYIQFTHDNRLNYALYAGLLFLSFSVWAFIYIVKQKKKVLVPYQAKAIDVSHADSKFEQIKAYIAEHYANPELSAQDLQQALGITEREIGLLIKKHLDSSFKSYLNTIRLAEVQRLLLETNVPVSEIAYNSGYNNIPHFNRVFKKSLDCTPKEFREANKKG